jgi:hypothetical protein
MGFFVLGITLLAASGRRCRGSASKPRFSPPPFTVHAEKGDGSCRGKARRALNPCAERRV